MCVADPGDEERHPPGPDQLWSEWWYFDFAFASGAEVAADWLGGYVRLGLYPNLGVAWYWAYLVGSGRSLVAVRDHDVALPKGPSLEVRAEGLWSALTCETPYEHWSIGLEAFAVALDDPVDAYRDERGDRVALGFDLEWYSEGPVVSQARPARQPAAPPLGPGPAASGYEQTCRVQGEVLLGDERLWVEGSGQRHHAWGIGDWWGVPWCWTAGRLDDGTAFQGTRVGPAATSWLETGYLLAPGGSPAVVSSVTVDTLLGGAGLPVSGSLGLGELTLAVTPLAYAPVLLSAPDGRSSRLPRALCRFDAPDGRRGLGWTEWLQP